MAKLKDLAGFPAVLAMGEGIINHGLKRIYGAPQSPPLPVPAAMESKGEERWKVEADFGSPTIDFDTDLKNGCRLKIPVVSGDFATYTYDGEEFVPDKIDISGYVFYFTTPITHIKHKKLSNDIFDVRAIFADLSQVSKVEFGSSKDMKVSIGSSLKSSFIIAVRDQVKAYGKANPDAFLFGLVNTAASTQSLNNYGVLTPKQCAYSVTKKLDANNKYLTGALNILLWLDSDAMPTGDAVGEFNDLLLQKKDADKYAPATLVLSDTLLLNKFVKPALVSKYAHDGRQPNLSVDSRMGAQQAKLHLNGGHYTYHKDGDDHTYFTKLNARIDTAILIDYGLDIRQDHWSGDTYSTGDGSATVSLNLKPNGQIGTDTNAPAPHFTTDSNTFTRILGDAVSLGFDEIGRSYQQANAAISIAKLGNAVANTSNRMLSHLRLPAYESYDMANLNTNGNVYINLMPPGFIPIPPHQITGLKSTSIPNVPKVSVTFTNNFGVPVSLEWINFDGTYHIDNQDTIAKGADFYFDSYKGHCFGIFVDNACVAVFCMDPYLDFPVTYTLDPYPQELIKAIKLSDDTALSNDVIQKIIAARTSDPNYYWSQFSWNDINSQDQTQWAALGYTQAFWDNAKAGVLNTDSLSWDKLSVPQQKAVEYLGFNASTWNSPSSGDALQSGDPNSYYEKYGWSDLGTEVARLWGLLGMTAAMWETHKEVEKTWSELSTIQQKAAFYLGYRQPTWDE